MNTELQALYEQDQADRSVFFEQLDHEQVQQVLQRDRARRQRVGNSSEAKHCRLQRITSMPRWSFNMERRWRISGELMSLQGEGQN